MAITTQDQLIAAMPGQKFPFIKGPFSPQAAAALMSLWTISGAPGAGSAPSSTGGVVPTSSTAGGIPFSNPGGGSLSYLANWGGLNSQVGCFVLYDRLVHTDGLSGTATGAQTIGTPSITRPNSNGSGVQCFIECYTATGSTSRTATISYTNQSGTSGQTSGSVTIPASMAANRMIGPFPLSGTDSGVRAVASLTLSASTGTAGNFGITLLRPVAFLMFGGASTPATFDVFDLGMPAIDDSSCLAAYIAAQSTTSQTLHGMLQIIQG